MRVYDASTRISAEFGGIRDLSRHLSLNFKPDFVGINSEQNYHQTSRMKMYPFLIAFILTSSPIVWAEKRSGNGLPSFIGFMIELICRRPNEPCVLILLKSIGCNITYFT